MEIQKKLLDIKIGESNHMKTRIIRAIVFLTWYSLLFLAEFAFVGLRSDSTQNIRIYIMTFGAIEFFSMLDWNGERKILFLAVTVSFNSYFALVHSCIALLIYSCADITLSVLWKEAPMLPLLFAMNCVHVLICILMGFFTKKCVEWIKICSEKC